MGTRLLPWIKWCWRIALALYWIAALLGYGPGAGMTWLGDLETWLRLQVPDPIVFAFVSGLILSAWIIPDVWKWSKKYLVKGQTENLRLATQKLLRYPEAAQDTVAPPTMIEQFAADQQPRRLFELLMRYEEKDIGAVPRIGEKLHEHFVLYHKFRQSARQFDVDLLTKIINGQDWFLAAWRIHQRYVMFRLLGASQEQIIAWGNFLNYSITWDSAEKVFERVSGDSAITEEASKLAASHERLSAIVIELTASI